MEDPSKENQLDEVNLKTTTIEGDWDISNIDNEISAILKNKNLISHTKQLDKRFQSRSEAKRILVLKALNEFISEMYSADGGIQP